MSNTKHTIGEIKDTLKGYVPVMDGLSRARNPFELRYFVIGKHDDRVQQYKQAVIEMDAKYKAVQEALHGKAIRALDREEKLLELIENPESRKDQIANERIMLEVGKLDREDHDSDIAMTGAFKEVMDFITIIETEYSDLIDKTEEELLKSEPNYWGKRLAKQIHIDMQTIGKIGEGNRTVLENLPREFQEQVLAESMLRTHEHNMIEDTVAKKVQVYLAESYPRATTYLAPPTGIHVPLKFRKDAPEGYPADRIVDVDRAEIMIATLHRPNDREWLSTSFYIPGGKNYITTYIECPNGELIGEYRNRLVMDALSLGCEHLFFVDDDLLVPQDALQKLYAHKLDVVGGWYTKKEPVPESATLIKTEDGKSCMPVPKEATGLIDVDWVLTGGLTLIDMKVFKTVQYPWYNTSYQATEDTYFSARLLEAGIKQWLDTSIKAIHVDKATRTGYGFDGIQKLT